MANEPRRINNIFPKIHGISSHSWFGDPRTLLYRVNPLVFGGSFMILRLLTFHPYTIGCMSWLILDGSPQDIWWPWMSRVKALGMVFVVTLWCLFFLETYPNTLPKTNIAIENPPFWWYLQGNKWVFMGYVRFREGISTTKWWLDFMVMNSGGRKSQT